MVTREQIESFQDEAAVAGDMVALAVCRLAVGDRIGTHLGEADALRFERLDLDDNEDRAAALVGSWVEDGEVR